MFAGAKEISDLGLWGNYSIPADNPYSEDKQLQPEIWALGFRNPWRCSFDAERPSYFLCADVGQVGNVNIKQKCKFEVSDVAIPIRPLPSNYKIIKFVMKILSSVVNASGH